MVQVLQNAEFDEKMLAMNEALVLGSLRQHELAAASISRWETGADGFTKDDARAARLLRFVAQNPDQSFKHDAELAIIDSRFGIAGTPEDVQAQLDAIAHYAAGGSIQAVIQMSEMLKEVGRGDAPEIGKLLKIAAEAGDKGGMRDYGKYLLSDPSIDVMIGRTWVEKAAAAGDLKAKLELLDPTANNSLQELDRFAASGQICSIDLMVNIARKYASVPDPAAATRAVRWLENAATSVGQSSKDLSAIGAAYRDGIAGLGERHLAEKYFTGSLALGRKSAARELADGHLKKLWSSPDPLKAKTLLFGLFNSGDALAGNKLLGEYANGAIPATATDVKLLVEALGSKINSPAKVMLKLARLNEEGRLGVVDESLVAQWLMVSAAAGEPNAMFRLSGAYISAIGVERSPATGVQWLQKAAEAGNYKAAEGLAAAYETGFGLEKDAQKSGYWKDRAKSLKTQ